MSEKQGSGAPRKRRPDLDTVYSINDDGSRNFLHPADVRGRWQTLKNLMFPLLIMIYALMPWITVKGHPLVHVDLPDRSAHLFGLSFTNQDFYLTFFVITGIGFGLFVVTAVWGRIWCGYACPQTVFMEGVVRKLERLIEGPRIQRIRRNLGPMTAGKALRKGLKHALILIGSSLIAHIFLSYFLPVRELVHAVWEDPGNHSTAFFWTTLWTLIMFFNFSWFREQTCIVICPYGRLQSSLIDEDTLIIGYDEKRGEPRFKSVDSGGDCVDCYRCVEVCPTGIDIRNGLQMECIGCANCIDACDDVMDKIGKSRGLVRYDSQRGLRGLGRRKLLRPRFFIYATMGLIGLTVASLSIGSRESFHANALRARGMPYVIENDRISNLVNLRIQNKTDQPGVYLIDVVDDNAGLDVIIPQSSLRLGAMQDDQTPVFLYLDRALYEEAFPVHLTVTDSLSGVTKQLKVTFRGP
jgi:cytochrome c oxidase accessory protein FixG